MTLYFTDTNLIANNYNMTHKVFCKRKQATDSFDKVTNFHGGWSDDSFNTLHLKCSSQDENMIIVIAKVIF